MIVNNIPNIPWKKDQIHPKIMEKGNNVIMLMITTPMIMMMIMMIILVKSKKGW